MNKLDNEFLEKINKLIEDRLSSEKIDIGYLSDAMCMSNSTLYRKMKALTGLSTNEYIRKIKMQYAERLLLEGKYNISEVAFNIVKPFFTVICYSLRQWTVRSAWVDYTVCCNGLYGPLAESVVSSRKK